MSRNTVRRLLAGAAALAAVSLAGCVAYPAAPYPAYAGGYGYYAPGYVYGPPVGVAVGIGGGWRGGWRGGYWR